MKKSNQNDELKDKSVSLTNLKFNSVEFKFYHLDIKNFHNPEHEYIYCSLITRILYIIDVKFSRLPYCCVPLIYLDFDINVPFKMGNCHAHKHLKHHQNIYFTFWCDNKACLRHTLSLRCNPSNSKIYLRPNTLKEQEELLYTEQSMIYYSPLFNNRPGIMINNSLTERVNLFTKLDEVL